MRDLPRYDRSTESPLQSTLRAFATGALIACLLMSPFVSLWLILVGFIVFGLTAFIAGLIEGAQESRQRR